MAAGAEEKPRLRVVRLLRAAALEQGRRLAGPARLEQAQGVAMRMKSHDGPRIECAPEGQALPETGARVLP